MPVDVEIPTTVIGLVGFIIFIEAGIIYFLLKQLFDLTAKYAEIASKSAEGAAAVASGLREVATAVQQGRDVDALRKQMEQFAVEIKDGRSRKS